MDNQWYEQKKEEALHDIGVAVQLTCKLIEQDSNLQNVDKKYLIEKVRTCQNASADDFKWLIYGIKCVNQNDDYLGEEQYVNTELGFGVLQSCKSMLWSLERLLDSEWVDIEGDIVITDPCYTTNEWREGFDLDSLPLCRDTIYGDWGCTTFDSETKEEIGSFCADAGMVCVDTLENILKRKPDFLEKYGEWCRTIIKNFKGMVRFKIVCLDEQRDKVKFDTWNYEVRVEGMGVNTKTGEKICFITSQTSL